MRISLKEKALLNVEWMVSDYIDEVLQEDESLTKAPRREGDDGGITFTAKSPRRYSA